MQVLDTVERRHCGEAGMAGGRGRIKRQIFYYENLFLRKDISSSALQLTCYDNLVTEMNIFQ